MKNCVTWAVILLTITVYLVTMTLFIESLVWQFLFYRKRNFNMAKAAILAEQANKYEDPPVAVYQRKKTFAEEIEEALRSKSGKNPGVSLDASQEQMMHFRE